MSNLSDFLPQAVTPKPYTGKVPSLSDFMGSSVQSASTPPKTPSLTDFLPASPTRQPRQQPAPFPGKSVRATSSRDSRAPSYDVRSIVSRTATKYGIPPAVALGVAQQESGFNQNARSPKGAIGVMQLEPGTAKGLGVDPTDLNQNIDGGIRYLKQLHDKYAKGHSDADSWKLALAAYNAGEGAVDSHGGVPPYKETQQYVNNILGGIAKLPGGLMKALGGVKAAVANAPGIRDIGNAARNATAPRPVYVPMTNGVPDPTSAIGRAATASGLGWDEAGRVLDRNGKPVTTSWLNEVLGVALPAGAAPGSESMQRGLGAAQRVASNLPAEGRGPIAQAAAPVLRNASGQLTMPDVSGIVAPVHRALAEGGATSRAAIHVADELHGLGQADIGDQTVMRQLLSQPEVKGLTLEQKTAITHYAENNSLPLDPKLKDLFNRVIKPQLDQITEIRNRLKGEGFNTDTENWLTRKAIAHGQAFERTPGVGGKAALRTSGSVLKGRTMKALTDEQGNRVVVSMKPDQVTGWVNGTPIDMGPMKTPQLQDVLSQRIRPFKNQLSKAQAELRGLFSHPANSPQLRLQAARQADATVQEIQRQAQGIINESIATGQARVANVPQQFGRLMTNLQSEYNAWKAAAYGGADKINALTRTVNDLKGSIARISSEFKPEDLEGKVFVASKGPYAGRWFKIGDAPISEIEQHSPVTYSKDPFAVVGERWLEARRIDRATKFLTDLQNDPEFQTNALQVPKGTPASQWPKGWGPTTLQKFGAPSENAAGWVFSPKMKAVLDQYQGAVNSGNLDLVHALNRAVTSLIFINPVAHFPNLGINWLVSAGLPQLGRAGLAAVTGDAKGAITPIRAFVKAFNVVKNQDPEYLDMVLQGHPGELAKSQNRKFFQGLSQQIQLATKDPETMTRLKAIVGGANPLRYLNGVSNYLTWFGDDLLRTQAVFDLEARGVNRGQAIREINRVIPDYRMPAFINLPGGKYTEQAGIQMGKALNNEVLFMFQRYHSSLLKSLLKMGTLQGETAAERLRNVTRLGALFLTMQVIQPWADGLAQQITGNKRAYTRRAGFTAPIYNVSQVSKGLEPTGQAVTSIITPSPAYSMLSGLYNNRDQFTGKPISASGTTLTPPSPLDIAKSTIYPIQQWYGMGTGAQTPTQLAESFAGVNTPKLTPTESRFTFADKDFMTAQRTKAMKFAQSGNQEAAQRVMNAASQKVASDMRAMLQDQIQRGIRPKMTPTQIDNKINQYIRSEYLLSPLTSRKVNKSKQYQNLIPGDVLPNPPRTHGFGGLRIGP